jgi:hypothetical protein
MDFFTRTASAAADVFQHWPEGIGGGDPDVRQVGYPVLVRPDEARTSGGTSPSSTTSALDERARELGATIVQYDAGEIARKCGVDGAIPEYAGLYADFGWSGHGFKHAHVIGDLLSDLALRGDPDGYDLRPFRWSRFYEGDLLPPDRGPRRRTPS